MSFGKTVKLENGAQMPMLGLGTWQSKEHEVARAVEHAIHIGYRLIDCAHAYINEKAVGEGIKNSGIPRDQIFITSKLWNTFHNPKDVPKAIDNTLKDLGVDYIDLYLMHWPCSFKAGTGELFPRDKDGNAIDDGVDFVDTWKAMINDVLKTGKAKAIGVSNFTIPKLQRLIDETGVKPAVLQVELHPYLPQWALVNFCREQGIVVNAYSPLGGSSSKKVLREDPVINAVAKRHNASPAQVLLAWGIHRGCVVIPKSIHFQRIDSNFKQITLTAEDMSEIDMIRYRERTCGVSLFGTNYSWIFDQDEN